MFTRKKLVLLTAGLALTATSAFAFDKPVTLTDQGSFMVGGKTVTAPGTYVDSEPNNLDGETKHGDAAYVFYQVPQNAKHNAVVFLHGYGQSGKSWESTPDGRDGFQNIFLEKGYKTYNVDQPRRGRAGNSTLPAALTATPQDQLWFDNFRMGQNNKLYKNVSFPKGEEALDQFFKSMVPDTGPIDNKLVAEDMSALFDKIGDGVLITHSAGGGPGWETAIMNPHVKGVIALEPGTFPFPEGEVPAVEKTTSPWPAMPMTVSKEDFEKITKIPVIVYFGDNIPTGGTPIANWGEDNWRVRLNLARKWEKVMKDHGADCTIVVLPDAGIKGNDHFIMADLNNKEVADHIEKWMKSKGLDK
jgi:pimeloyl-ACP methyl ester carboxylesterase